MFDKMRDGDRVISVLNENEARTFSKVQEQHGEFEYFRAKMVRAYNKFQALQVLFWEDMMGKHEQCESASHRGKVLSTCRVGDDLVIVERAQEAVLDEDQDLGNMEGMS
jgi:hypothetical protein